MFSELKLYRMRFRLLFNIFLSEEDFQALHKEGVHQNVDSQNVDNQNVDWTFQNVGLTCQNGDWTFKNVDLTCQNVDNLIKRWI